MEARLDGKVALVTGGSRGIGKAIARTFVEAGARVMITSRNEESCRDAAKEIGPACDYEAGHIARDEDTERVLEATMQRLGRLDILVNNAATNPYAGPTIGIDRPRWQKTLDLNLTAPLVWSQHAWRIWMKEHGGSIVNLSSVGALASHRDLGAYDVTKAALLHLTRQLAAELAPGVRVNAIAPGLIKTEFARMLWEGERGERIAAKYPLKRLGEVEDVAAAACFLASDAAGWITGQTWVLDGGALVAFTNLA